MWCGHVFSAYRDIFWWIILFRQEGYKRSTWTIHYSCEKDLMSLETIKILQPSCTNGWTWQICWFSIGLLSNWVGIDTTSRDDISWKGLFNYEDYQNRIAKQDTKCNCLSCLDEIEVRYHSVSLLTSLVSFIYLKRFYLYSRWRSWYCYMCIN